MIFNKYLSILFSACLFLLMMFLVSSVLVTFLKGTSLTIVIAVLIVIFWRISRSFYNYLRKDDFYDGKALDRNGEKYLIKGETDTKKVFLVVWVILVLIILSFSLWLYSVNNGLV